MSLLIIKTNPSAPATSLLDLGIEIAGGGASVSLDNYDEIVEAQNSRNLRVLLVDNAYGVGSSTLILNDGSFDLPQANTLMFLDTVLLTITHVPVNYTAVAQRINEHLAGLDTPRPPLTHAFTHIDGGSDVIDGDQVEITYIPTNYVRTLATETTALDQLTSHLKGLDVRSPTGGEKQALVGTVGTPSSSNRYVTESDPRLGLGEGGRRLYFPIADSYGDSTHVIVGDHVVNSLSKSSGSQIVIPFKIPSDFASLTSLKVVIIPTTGAALSNRNLDLTSDYGSLGELYNQHSESNTTITYNLTGFGNRFTTLDVSSVFTSLSGGDYCGLTITNGSDMGGVIYYVGVLIQYTAG